MVQTTISIRDPNTGDEVLCSAELRDKVHRAAKLLEEQLGEVSQQFPVEARWQFYKKGTQQGDQSVAVRLNLLSDRSHGVEQWYPVPADEFRDDTTALRSLRMPMWMFGRELSNVVKSDLERIDRALGSLLTVTGE
jgi:hypothetical protein